MTVRLAAVALLALAGVPLGCDRGRAPPPAERASSLGPGVAALVGESPIPLSLVAEVARAQSIDPKTACERLIADALAAAAAQATGAERDPTIAWLLESVRARAVSEEIRRASQVAGPPTDAEIAKLTEERWRDVALPEQVKVIHVVVLRPEDPQQYSAARRLAALLAAAVAPAKSEDQFESAARAVPSGALEVHIDRLPAIVADGRASEGPPSVMDAMFAQAAFTLKKPGETSGVVETTFGWHVIRLVERRPAKEVPLEERRAVFAQEVFLRRAHDALAQTLAAHRAVTGITVSSSADAMMSGLSRKETPP